MSDKLTLELDKDEAYVLFRVIREALDNGCGDLEVDDEDLVMNVRDSLFQYLWQQDKYLFAKQPNNKEE